MTIAQGLLDWLGFSAPVADSPLTERAAKGMYERPRSFVDRLPWTEYLPAERAFLLDDGRSVGALYAVRPKGTEGRSSDYLVALRDAIQAALSRVFDEHDAGPWVVQFYCYDEPSLDEYMKRLEGYIRPELRDHRYASAFLDTMAEHLESICRPQGLFHDRAVTDGPWRGRERHVRLVLYRRWPARYRHPAGLTPAQELNETCQRLENALQAAGVLLTRLTGHDFYRWLLPWFNPAPAITGGARAELVKLTETSRGADLPYGHDFAESLFFSRPRSDLKTQTWWFDGRPHRCLSVERLRAAPAIGLTTAERTVGDRAYALFDRLPEGTVMALTMIAIPQDRLENHLNLIESRAVGEGLDARQTRKDVETAKDTLVAEHKLYRMQLAFYLAGRDLNDLRLKGNQVASVLLTHDLAPIADTDDPIGLDQYLMNLPMVYDPILDRRRRGRLTFTQHIANLVPVYGRSRGTENPGFTFFNRGAEPFSLDPLSLSDRKKNAHLLLLGPTGAGKSATLVSLLCQVMATVRPRLYIVEVGNSFGLMADYLRDQGLSVHKVALKGGAGVSLPPFADAARLFDSLGSRAVHGTVGDSLDDSTDEPATFDDGSEEPETVGRDLLGEMELIALIMITGGEVSERQRLTRSDRRTVRDAICRAARYAKDNGQRQVLTEDVVTGLVSLSFDEDLSPRKRERAEEMADAMALFTDGLEGELFNRPGRVWPDVDVTLIDLATFAREGYEAQLAVAYTSIMNAIHNRIERHQHDSRPTIMVTDEGHVITTNPLLAPYVVKVVKMWRKLGAWYWIATQNLEDFPDAAKRLLNMIEWWLCLVMPKEEIDQIARFKALTPERKQLLLSARKEPGLYTEGVVLSDTVEALFRHVPPPLYLALAMTEKDEKAERQRLMEAHGISEVAAAIKVAEHLRTRSPE
jgi:conjugative transfer ATPase